MTTHVRPPSRYALALLLALLPACLVQAAPDAAARRHPRNVDPGTLALESIARVVVDADGDTVPDRKGQIVRVRGVVVTPSGVLRNRGFLVYIQDATGGMGLYNSRDIGLELAAGDVVEAWGELNQFKGAIQLQDVAARRTGRTALPAPVQVSLPDADGWRYVGRRVRVEGVAGAVMLDRYGMLRITDDDGVPMQLYVPGPVADRFDWKRIPRGTRVAATGVLSLYKPTWPFDRGFQVVLASPADLVVLQPPPPEWHRWFAVAVLAAAGLLAVGGLMLHLLHRRQRARDRELSTLSALSAALADTDVGEEQLARNTCEILTAYDIVDGATVHLADDAGRLHGVAHSANDARLARVHEAAGDDGTEALRLRLRARGLHALGMHALHGVDTPLGVLVGLAPRVRRATQMQERTLLAAAKLLAMAIENRRVRERARREQQALQELVITDELTRLYNRRFLDEYLRVQVPLAERRGGGLAFVALDIDHFKHVNDTYGHEAGDRVLAGIAGQLRQASRSCDLPVRLGGEEFLVVIAEHDIDGAMTFAERLRAAIAALAFEDVAPGASLRVTVSIGVAVFGLHGTDASALMRASDEAMYASKRGGRDRVSLSTALPAIGA